MKQHAQEAYQNAAAKRGQSNQQLNGTGKESNVEYRDCDSRWEPQRRGFARPSVGVDDSILALLLSPWKRPLLLNIRQLNSRHSLLETSEARPKGLISHSSHDRMTMHSSSYLAVPASVFLQTDYPSRVVLLDADAPPRQQ